MKSIKTLILFLLIFLLIFLFQLKELQAQGSYVSLDLAKKDSLRVQALKMLHAIPLDDTLTLINHLYPGLLDKFYGGENNVAKSLTAGKRYSAYLGYKDESVALELFKRFAKVKDEIYTFIDIKKVSTIKGDTLKSASFLLAITKDEGNHWYFIDASFLEVMDIKLLFPNYEGFIPVPKFKMPTFIEKKKEDF